MKFINRYGRSCRYKFGDKVKDECYYPLNEIYIVHDANWIGNSNGMWELILEDSEGKKITRYFTTGLKKIGSIFD